MRFSRFRRPSPALVISVVALMVAMGGTGYAALKLPQNSVGSKQIKPNSVDTSKVKNSSLLASDFKKGQLPSGAPGKDGAVGAAGPAGAQGPSGLNGADGADGARGPSDGYQGTGGARAPSTGSASVAVPAGDYVATGSGEAENIATGGAFPAYNGETNCTLTAAADPTHNTGTFATVPNHGYNFSGLSEEGGTMTVALTSGFHLPNGGTIVETCADAQYSEQKPLAYSNIRVTAVRVGTLHP